MIYLKRISAQTSKVVITAHETWDMNRFLASQQAEQRKLRDSGKDHDVITLATQEEYRAAHWPKK